MTDRPKDFEVWTAFVRQLSKTFLSKDTLGKSIHSDSGLDNNTSNEWDSLIQQMDTLHHKRHNYVARETPASIKHKQSHPQLAPFSYVASPFGHAIDVLDLDRIDKKQLPKIFAHQIAVVDLHGCTLASGYEKLNAAMALAVLKKAKILKVITGKGRPDPAPESPTLRSIFPKWMQEPRLNMNVIKIRKAPKEHGGAGAFLIYLKRSK